MHKTFVGTGLSDRVMQRVRNKKRRASVVACFAERRCIFRFSHFIRAAVSKSQQIYILKLIEKNCSTALRICKFPLQKCRAVANATGVNARGRHTSASVFNISRFRLTELSLNVRFESEIRLLKGATRKKEGGERERE